MKKTILFGASESAIQCHFDFTHDSPHEIAAFTVDGKYIQAPELRGLPVVPFEDVEQRYPPSEFNMFIATYSNNVNKTRAEKYEQAKAKGYEMISFVSPKAITWEEMVIGENCYISEGVILKPFTKIENNVMVMPGALVGHFSTIKEHCFIGSRAVVLGGVTVEPYCVIGPAATILDSVIIAAECIIGAGCVIHENTKEREVYRANPPVLLPLPSNRMAKLLSKRNR